jgi:hypothetical protein
MGPTSVVTYPSRFTSGSKMQGVRREPDRTEIMDSISLKYLIVLMIVGPLACSGSTPTVASNGGGNGAGGTQGSGGGSSMGGESSDAASGGSLSPDASNVAPTAAPIAAAVTHACAIRNGAVYCWGENHLGQLGDGTTNDSSVPVQVQGLSSDTHAVAAGLAIGCSIAAGGVYCWGDYGVNQGSLVAIAVQGLPSAAQSISAVVNGCRALVDGAMYGWSYNFVAAAVQNPGYESGVEALSGACVVKSHSAYCAGESDFGQLGNGTITSIDSEVLVQVSGLTSGVTAIASGWFHVCAVMNGAAYCWGADQFGQLGHVPVSGGYDTDQRCYSTRGINPLGDRCQPVPTAVQGLPAGVTAITAGTYHTCAIANGLAYCWGDDAYGQLGDGTTTTTYQPVQVKNLTNVTAISAGAFPDSNGYDETCAVANGDVYCWGSNAYGQLGDGTTNDSSVPVKVQFPDVIDAG